MELEQARIGDLLFEVEEPGRSADELKRYAIASGDLNPLHLDRDFARQAGFPDLVVHGMLNMARLGAVLTERLPEGWDLRELRTRFEGVLTVGIPCRITARLAGRDEHAAEVELAMRTFDERAIAGGVARVGR